MPASRSAPTTRWDACSTASTRSVSPTTRSSLYIFGDNGASLEGTESGTFNELTALNGIPLTTDQQLEAIKRYGGLEVWGGPRTDPHYAAAWALGGQHAVPVGQAGRVASRRHAQRHGGVVAEADRRQGHVCAASSRTPSTSRRRSSKSPASQRRRPSMASRRCRCTAPASPTPSTTRRHPSDTPSSTSRSWATARCTRTAGCGAVASSASRGSSTPRRSRASRRASGIRKTTPASSTTSRATTRRARTSRRSIPTGCASSTRCSGARPRSTRSCRCFGGLAQIWGMGRRRRRATSASRSTPASRTSRRA